MSMSATSVPLSSSECSPTQRNHADHTVFFSDGRFQFGDSWTCHTQSCTARQRLIQCNTLRSQCMNSWSCQQCIYGGTDLQCTICADLCRSTSCFTEPCYAYFCSDSLRAYQCYYDALNCFHDQMAPKAHSVANISSVCHRCALNVQDVDSCYGCYNACRSHSCWLNCSMNSNFVLHDVIFSNNQSMNGSAGSGAINGGEPLPFILTSNALYGIIAMIALICMIFGFWCGKNCSAHFVSKLFGKWCAVCCDDHDDEEVVDDEEDSAWHWAHTQHKTQKRNRLRARMKNTGKRKRGSKENSNKRASMTMDTNDDGQDEMDDTDGESYEEHTSDEHEHETAQHALLKEKQRNYGSNRHRLKWSMTPLSSRSLLPGQQSTGQSPVVRVAHFHTPLTKDAAEIPHATSFGFSNALGTDVDVENGCLNSQVECEQPLRLEKMASVESDEEDAPPNPSSNIAPSRSCSQDNNKVNVKKKRKKFHDLDVEDSSKRLKSAMHTKRVASVDSAYRKIIVLQSKSSRKRVVSPPAIHSKSEFKMLLRPVQSADVVALKKRNNSKNT